MLTTNLAMNIKRITYLLLGVILSVISPRSSFSISNRVAIKAEADQEFLKARGQDGSKKPMTYQVAKGKFYF